MLESLVVIQNSGGSSTSTAVAAAVNLENEDGGEGESATNRWPLQETLDLLQVRSSMDALFRATAIKAPLWDEISRKLGDMGYNRGAKKCKEKFENIYKYHKRTKEGRSGRQNGKSDPFFEEQQIFDSEPSPPSSPLNTFDSQPSLPSPPINKININFGTKQTMPVPEMTTSSVKMVKPISQVSRYDVTTPSFIPNPSFELISTSTSIILSSEKESERNVKKKRKLVDYFDGLMKEVLKRQENLQNKFIEAVEKCEKDRMGRAEEWKMHQLARKKKEQEIFTQEQAVSAAKNAAIIAFLQRLSEQPGPVQLLDNLNKLEKIINMKEFNNGGNLVNLPKVKRIKSDNLNSIQVGSSSRWPKAEIEALIGVKENLDFQCSENGPKGLLWEEISSAMKKLGYDRSSKRCKEKWENMNKYYRKVKESNKKRPEDSKTCTYFHMLDSLYERKSKKLVDGSTSDSIDGCNLKPEDV